MMNTNQQAQGAFQQQQAVVIGGGKVGLLAARVLSEHFEQVTIIERQLLYANNLLLEEYERKALMHKGTVRIIDNCDVTGIGVLDDRIVGVYLRYREEEPFKKLFQVDFVVDASGSGSLTPQWLAFLGYGTVPESSVKCANRRHYERMKRLPKGLIVMGAALCCFNPIYGEDMSIAALEAKLLDCSLRQQVRQEKADKMYNWTPRFQKSLARVVDAPWKLATDENVRFKEAQGKRLFDTLLFKAKRDHKREQRSTYALA